jgi:hypothetical protein
MLRILPLLALATACVAEVAPDETDGDEIEDGVAASDPDAPALTDETDMLEAGSCSLPRTRVCHVTDNNCSYPGARRCDPLPRAFDRAGGSMYFPIAGTGHVLEDSTGAVIGTVTATSTRLNFGQRRLLHGTKKVLAFAVATTSGVRTGWINESAIGGDLSWMPNVHGRAPGGTFSEWHIAPSDNAPYLDGDGDSLKVVRTCGSGRNATDYLSRNGHANLIFNLPGHDPALGSGTIDSYPNDQRIVFERAQDQHSIERPLYSCRTGSPVKTSRTLRFVYGRVRGASTRYGWIALPNLRPGL